MIAPKFDLDWALFGSLVVALFLFGVIYNDRVGKAGDSKEGYVSFLVAIGVVVTLAVLAVFDLEGAILALALFAASGTPMIYGDVRRHIENRKKNISGIASDINKKGPADGP